MLSDEMTTGSVTTSDAEKRAYAARSHMWNIEQRRFKEAFPEVSIITGGRYLSFLYTLTLPASTVPLLPKIFPTWARKSVVLLHCLRSRLLHLQCPPQQLFQYHLYNLQRKRLHRHQTLAATQWLYPHPTIQEQM